MELILLMRNPESCRTTKWAEIVFSFATPVGSTPSIASASRKLLNQRRQIHPLLTAEFDLIEFILTNFKVSRNNFSSKFSALQLCMKNIWSLVSLPHLADMLLLFTKKLQVVWFEENCSSLISGKRRAEPYIMLLCFYVLMAKLY